MEGEKITVLARLRAKEGMAETVKAELLALVGPSRADAGCLNYDLHQVLDDETLFVVYENWQSKEHLDRHLGTPHLQALLAKADELLAAPPEIILLAMLSPAQ